MNLRAYLGHSGWLLSERVLRLTIGVGITALVARALGPADFGRLAWAQSVIALFGPFVGLGFDALIAKWLIREAEASGRYFATAFLCKLVSACLANAILLVAWLSGVHADMLLVAILGLTLLAQLSTLFDQYFQARLAGRVCALVQIVALLAGGGLKLLLVLNGAGLAALAAAIVFEQFLALGLFVAAYRKDQARTRLAFGGFALAPRLLKESSPLILSSAVGIAFLVVDQLMLRALAGPEALGIFAAAARITEAWYALLAVLAAALYPAILRAERKNIDAVMGLCYEIAIGVSLLTAVLVTIAAPWLVGILYGDQFVAAATVLTIHIWTGIFIGLRLFSGKWMLSEGLTWLIFSRSVSGIAVNILLGLWLIPAYGALGAAVSTLVTYVTVGFLFDFVNPVTRKQGMLKFKALSGSQTLSALKALRTSSS